MNQTFVFDIFPILSPPPMNPSAGHYATKQSISQKLIYFIIGKRFVHKIQVAILEAIEYGIYPMSVDLCTYLKNTKGHNFNVMQVVNMFFVPMINLEFNFLS